jgi:hypothetical protein
MSCLSLEGCPFFNDRLTDMPAMAEIYKKNIAKATILLYAPDTRRQPSSARNSYLSIYSRIWPDRLITIINTQK